MSVRGIKALLFITLDFSRLNGDLFIEKYINYLLDKSRLDLSVLADGSRLFIRMCPARISADRQVRTICFITLLPYISKIPI